MTRRDPSTFESSVRRPDDFDEYWAETEAATMANSVEPAASSPIRCDRRHRLKCLKRVTTALRRFGNRRVVLPAARYQRSTARLSVRTGLRERAEIADPIWQ